MTRARREEWIKRQVKRWGGTTDLDGLASLVRDAMSFADQNPVGGGKGQMEPCTTSQPSSQRSSSATTHPTPAPRVYDLLVEALCIANEPDDIDLRLRETRIVNWKQQALAALDAEDELRGKP